MTLRPGKTVLTRPQTIGQTDFYTFEATFIPDRRGNDVTTENKHATAFTHVAGKGRVLLIVNKEKEGGEDHEACQLLRKPAAPRPWVAGRKRSSLRSTSPSTTSSPASPNYRSTTRSCWPTCPAP